MDTTGQRCPGSGALALTPVPTRPRYVRPVDQPRQGDIRQSGLDQVDFHLEIQPPVIAVGWPTRIDEGRRPGLDDPGGVPSAGSEACTAAFPVKSSTSDRFRIESR